MCAFLVSPFGAAERTWKPFNPVLGETFEADKLANNAYFVAEQVRCVRVAAAVTQCFWWCAVFWLVQQAVTSRALVDRLCRAVAVAAAIAPRR